MLGGILSGVVLTWVTVASELSATVVLYSGQWRTMTVVMFQALEGGGAGIATAAATTLIVVTLIPVALLYRLLRRYELGRATLTTNMPAPRSSSSPLVALPGVSR